VKFADQDETAKGLRSVYKSAADKPGINCPSNGIKVMTNLDREKVEVQSLKVSGGEQNLLVNQCAAVLRQGIDLIETLPDALFTRSRDSEKSSVGTHFRHNLDFVTSFLECLESGKLDYNRRERNLRVETNRGYAALRLREAVGKIENLTPEILGKKVLVRSETVQSLWCESSVARELEFLQSHTIHHYALIQTKLASLGFSVPPDFGVAPSTLEFWKNSSESSF
jgi:hypothetical protein